MHRCLAVLSGWALQCQGISSLSNSAQCPLLLQVQSTSAPAFADTEQILELFPSQFLGKEARAEIRSRGLIQDLTAWMREQSLWKGFEEMDDLSLWQAHQWPGSHSDDWYGVPNTSRPIWWGQLGGGSPLLLASETNSWFNVSHYQAVWQPNIVEWPSDSEMLAGGMYFNHLTSEEVVGSIYAKWPDGHELRQVNLSEALPFRLPPLPVTSPKSTFIGYNMTGPDWSFRRAGVYLRGPGYAIDFCSIWDFDETGNSKLIFTAVYREVQLPKDANEDMERTVQMTMRENQSVNLISSIEVVKHMDLVSCFLAWLSIYALPVILGLLLQIDKQPRADALVGYRAFLVLTVFLYHAGLIPYSDVGAFFMLSGAVLTVSRRSAQQWEGPLEVAIWLTRRMLRILPPWWLSYAALQTQRTMESSATNTWSKALWSCWELGSSFLLFPFQDPKRAFLLVQDDTELGFAWFLQPLVCFYVLFPAFERIMASPSSTGQENRAVYVFAFCCCMKLSILWILSCHSYPRFSWYYLEVPWSQSPVSVYASSSFRWPDFVLGMCLPHVVQRENVDKIMDTFCLVDLAALMLVVILLSTRALGSVLLITLLNNNVQFPLHCIMICGFCGKGAECARAGRLLKSRAALLLGTVSYSFYLQQGAVLSMFGVWTGGKAHQWEVAYSFQVSCAFLVVLVTALAASEFAEVLPSKVWQRLTIKSST